MSTIFGIVATVCGVITLLNNEITGTSIAGIIFAILAIAAGITETQNT